MNQHEPISKSSNLDFSQFPALKEQHDNETAMIKSQLESRRGTLKKRSTLNLTLGLKFKPAFDDAIAERKDLKIFNNTGSNIEQFRVKVSEGLRYCMLHLDSEHKDYKERIHKEGDYARLRGECKIRTPSALESQDHVKLLFFLNYTKVLVSQVDETINDTWKEKLLDWIEKPIVNQPFSLRNLNLTESDVIEARSILLSFQEASKNIYNMIQVVEHDKVMVLVQLKEGENK